MSRPGPSRKIAIATASSTCRSCRRASMPRWPTRRVRSATAIAAALDYRGVLCVELFVTADGALLVNEIAPRPHNSGHYTIDACVTSQFEQQARILAALPLGDPMQLAPAVMVNLLGDIWFDRRRRRVARAGLGRVLGHGKAQAASLREARARRGRKMGHVTLPRRRRSMKRSRRRARSSAHWAFRADEP